MSNAIFPLAVPSNEPVRSYAPGSAEKKSLKKRLDEMQAAYAHAIAKEYRFYSYGDACLLFRQPQDDEDGEDE